MCQAISSRSRSSGARPVAVWNALADPREVLEQRAVLGWSARRITGQLHGAVLAVVRPVPA
jgi:hypothetical protein